MEPTQSAGFFESMSAAAIGLFASVVVAAPFVGLWLYQDYVGAFLGEVREESAGGAAGFWSVFIRKLGASLRRFMSAGYEASMRRKLTKGGDPQGFKPEDVLALQVVLAVAGLVFGLLITSALGVSVAWALLVVGLGGGYPLIWVND
jgi:tight adherence protein C